MLNTTIRLLYNRSFTSKKKISMLLFQKNNYYISMKSFTKSINKNELSNKNINIPNIVNETKTNPINEMTPEELKKKKRYEITSNKSL